MFSKTEEPLDADDWLQTIENNLEVAGVEAAEKVLFATHYLSGPARAWWTSARAMNAGQMMTWEDFKLKFSKYHVPQGLIKKMRDVFRELKQGRMSVVEYRDRFLTHKLPSAPPSLPLRALERPRRRGPLTAPAGHHLSYKKRPPQHEFLTPFASSPLPRPSPPLLPTDYSTVSSNFSPETRKPPQIKAIDPRRPELRHCARRLFALANDASTTALDRRRPPALSNPLPRRRSAPFSPVETTKLHRSSI
ncbi:hypothetical protein QYE76_015446 [Lolium multiflorum]|uniref:Retrotransposon gag domain-containing protein n=1 Tax=Lolium multiflorum TaxID=4521 RepID=A0AAD8X9V3_LOLMU|nr:hypothetical protein QYE76_015446 [Lolium multiflorum]